MRFLYFLCGAILVTSTAIVLSLEAQTTFPWIFFIARICSGGSGGEATTSEGGAPLETSNLAEPLKEEEEADARLRRFVAAVRDESSAVDDPIVLSPS